MGRKFRLGIQRKNEERKKLLVAKHTSSEPLSLVFSVPLEYMLSAQAPSFQSFMKEFELCMYFHKVILDSSSYV